MQAAQNAEELFDVVDEHDRVIGRATRGEVHAKGLLHRAVHVFLFNTAGELLLQMRSAAKDEYPLCWTSSASGHLDAGESYEQAAPREVREELGLELDLEYLLKLPASPATSNEHTVLYRGISDEPPTINTAEIDRVEFHPIDDVQRMIAKSPNDFSPAFRSLFAAYGNFTS